MGKKCLKQYHNHHECCYTSNVVTFSHFSNFQNFGLKYHLPRVQSPVWGGGAIKKIELQAMSEWPQCHLADIELTIIPQFLQTKLEQNSRDLPKQQHKIHIFHCDLFIILTRASNQF